MTREEKELIFNRLLELEERHPAFAENVRDNAYCEAIADAKRIIDGIKQPSLPSDLDEAAEEVNKSGLVGFEGVCWLTKETPKHFFKAGAEWMAGQGWIDDGSMPPETKRESDTLQGHREWTESEPVLAWDSLYGCRVDWTKNGKWVSEQMGGYTGQVCHGNIAWRPIPEYKEKQ